jgi:hypothetical protein
MAEPDHKRWENEQQEAIHEMKLKCGGREEKNFNGTLLVLTSN